MRFAAVRRSCRTLRDYKNSGCPAFFRIKILYFSSNDRFYAFIVSLVCAVILSLRLNYFHPPLSLFLLKHCLLFSFFPFPSLRDFAIIKIRGSPWNDDTVYRVINGLLRKSWSFLLSFSRFLSLSLSFAMYDTKRDSIRSE